MSSETTQSLTVYDLLAWLETNKKSLIIGFSAAVVIGFGIAIWRYTTQQRELAASEALLKLKTPVASDENVPAPGAAAYLKIASEFPGTRAADRALLLAGTTLFADGKYAQAQEEFSRFIRDNPQSPFAATAGYGVAASLEAEGKRDEALAAYQNLSVRFPNSSVLDDAKLAIARIEEARNQPQQALRMYDELIKGGAMSSASSEAMARKQALLAAHPDLAVTNAPAPAVSVAPAPPQNATATGGVSTLVVGTNAAPSTEGAGQAEADAKASPAEP